MPSANVLNLISIAENLVKKRLALRESAPVIFETLQNIDDQIRYAINTIVNSGEEGELDEAQISLVNNALSNTRASLIAVERDYTPNANDIVGELRDIKSVNFHELSRLQETNKELYEQLTKLGIYTPSN
jgi:DNA repair ATPase RecN